MTIDNFVTLAMRDGYTILSQNLGLTNQSGHAKRLRTMKTVLYLIIFGEYTPSQANPCAKGKTVTGNFYCYKKLNLHIYHI